MKSILRLLSITLTWAGIVPECGSEDAHIEAQIPFFPDAEVNYRENPPCVHLWPHQGTGRPTIAQGAIRNTTSEKLHLAFKIPPSKNAFMWFVWAGPCKRKSGLSAFIRSPSMTVTTYSFYLYRTYSYIKISPAKIGLSSDESLTLEASFPAYEPQQNEIKVWFIGKTHNKSKEATLIMPGKLVSVEAPSWPSAEKVEIRVAWCSGGRLSDGYGHVEFATEDSLFGQVAANVEEGEEQVSPNEDLHAGDHKTINMVEGSVHTFFDPEHNEFVKSRSGDGTKLDLDMTFMQGIILLTISAALCGSVATTIIPSIPISLGYILGGILVGPGGMDIIKELIQVETLAQLGVIFMLFELGMHFSLEKILAARRAALGGGLLLTLALLFLNMGISLLTGTEVQEGLLFGIFASLSSTALTSQISTDANLVAILIVQDVMLALFLASVPKILGVQEEETKWTPQMTVFVIAILCVKVAIVAAGVIFKWKPKATLGAELTLSLMVAWLMSVSYTSELLGFSFELGAFLAGFTLPIPTESAGDLISPLRSYFGVLFFGAIGLVVRPKFLWDNTFAVVSVALWLLVSKLFAGGLCMIACGVNRHDATVLSLRLAHVGEFGFVFASKGRSWGVLSRHVYLLLVGATAISIASAPLLFLFAEKEFNFLDLGLRRPGPDGVELQRLATEAEPKFTARRSDSPRTYDGDMIGNPLQSQLELPDDDGFESSIGSPQKRVSRKASTADEV